MLMGKYGRKAGALVGVLTVALIGVAAVGLWAGTAGPASTDAALVDPAAMDLDAGVCIGDLSEDLDSATSPDAGLNQHPCHGCNTPPGHCYCVSGFPLCCWSCGAEIFCQS
ncbi:MAG: hypothetical protein IH987_10195 [Planctomycetes bacterium]|nr:hypothetical protein [Planctomycetota bacterium]